MADVVINITDNSEQVEITVVDGPGVGGGGSGTVTSVSAVNGTGQTWTINNPTTTPQINLTLTKAAVGLSNVDNTSDANKPISTATQTALNAKEDTIVAGTTSQYYRGDKTFQTLDKSAVGLGNVDNTSDINKPVSTAQALADTAVQTAANSYTDAQVSTLLALIPFAKADVVKTATLTGTSSNTLLMSVEVTADTFGAGDVFDVMLQMSTNGAGTGNNIIFLYWNTTNSLSGALLLGFFGVGVAARTSNFIRTVIVRTSDGTGAGSQVFPTAANLITDFGTSSAFLPSTVAIDHTVTGYYIFSVQPGGVLAGVNGEAIILHQKVKA